MAQDYAESAEMVLDQLDEIMEAAYFVPLSLGDALAVQFKNPALNGLSLDEIARVLAIMDEIEPSSETADESVLVHTAGLFFTRLREDLPRIYQLWSEAPEDLYLDPAGAFGLALSRGERVIGAWLAQGPEEVGPDLLEKTRDQGLSDLISDPGLETAPDDRALRRMLRSGPLSKYPGWARPGLYLDAWAEYVRAVMDLSPRPETRARWPY